MDDGKVSARAGPLAPRVCLLYNIMMCNIDFYSFFGSVYPSRAERPTTPDIAQSRHGLSDYLTNAPQQDSCGSVRFDTRLTSGERLCLSCARSVGARQAPHILEFFRRGFVGYVEAR